MDSVHVSPKKQLQVLFLFQLMPISRGSLQFPLFPRRVELTSQHLINVARCLTTKMNIREVGGQLLLLDHQIEAALGMRTMAEAAFHMLSTWRNTQGDSVVAWGRLVRALDIAGLHRYAVQCLGADP